MDHTILEKFDVGEEMSAIGGDASSYDIPNEEQLVDEEPNGMLERAIESVANSSDSIRDLNVLDIYRFLLKKAEVTPGHAMGKLLDSVTSGFKTEMEALIRDVETGDQDLYMSHKVPLEIFGFLMAWFTNVADKVKVSDDEGGQAAKPKRGRGGKAAGGRTASRTVNKRGGGESWSWENQVPDLLALITRFLSKVQSQRIWTTSVERDAFIKCITKPAINVSYNDQYMKRADIREGVFEIFCRSVKSHNQSLGLQIHIVESLHMYEHLSEPMAECLARLANKFDHTQTGDEVLRDISGKVFIHSQDTKGPRAFARFLVRYTELCPKSTHKQLSLLISQQDSDSYPLRQAIVEILGHLITYLQTTLSTEADPEKAKKEIAGMFEHIFERMLDNSSYVRTKVLSVLSKLCDVETKFPKQRLAMTSHAIIALEDKAASVRKVALSLLIKLMATHPWSVAHEGMLNKEQFEEDYEKVRKDLAEVEKLGNAVVGNNDGDEEEGEGEDDNDEGEDGESQKKRKKKQRKDDDEMDVDEEGNEIGGDTDNEEEDEESMAVDNDEDEGEEGARPKKKRNKLKSRKSQLNVQALADEQAAVALMDPKEVQRLVLTKKFLKEALHFIKAIEKAMNIIEKLLGSKNKPEVLESIEFFKVAHDLELASAKEGLRKMLHLIWTKDNNTTISEDGQQVKGIRQKLLECYKHIYFEPLADPNMDAKAQVARIAKNLVERTYEATLAELTSLEEMLRIMMEEDSIHTDIISKLWQIYQSTRQLPKEQRRGAIIILGMLGIAKPDIVFKERVEVMLKVGLGKLGKIDLTLARYTCVALQRLNGSAKKVKGSLEDKTIRMTMDNPIFKKLMSTIVHPCRVKDWFGLAEQIVNTVYALGEQPDVFCNELIKRLTVRAFSRKAEDNARVSAGEGSGSAATAATPNPDAMDEDGVPTAASSAPPRSQEDVEGGEGDATMLDATATAAPSTISSRPPGGASEDLGDSFELSQLLFVVGHVAMKHIGFLELVEREWKRKKDEKSNGGKGSSKAVGGSGKEKEKENEKEVDELDQVVGNTEDEIGDQISAVRETELLYGEQSLLAIYGPLIVHICGSPHKFKNTTLRAAATLSFSKFLCVSAKFCDEHHRLLFKILETSKDANIRSNIVIALGDVAVAFNSVIDENSAALYRGLSDSNLTVKKNTLMVLTHLILNGMVKVKGQLGEMAKCVDDEDERISDLARLFFSELSGKDNAIYNNLQDVISHLSAGEHAVEEEKFESTMKFIFSFIEKDKQAESIIEKLCQRFKSSEDPRQWRDIAYCLSLLPFKSDKSVKKLIEGLQHYRDKLHEKGVYDRFQEILTKARQNKSKDKPDAELDEFEKILRENMTQGKEDAELESRMKKKRGGKAATRGRKKAVAARDED
ncbi:hypothetical protein FA15DRAFT_672413 [Coprinopsis marcescibilis]|uniref:Condensin complex subunit 1 n=1 Tax=Coprinopsis marcescibilis TaxID=230819 RepID=A0A5C3L053_COPMA|nr:hypothetical protein FA15DRAFT_672413 [Coprinopsis marcescibilis]